MPSRPLETPAKPAAGAVATAAATVEATAIEPLSSPLSSRSNTTLTLNEGNTLLAHHHPLHVDQITRNALASLLQKHAERQSSSERQQKPSNNTDITIENHEPKVAPATQQQPRELAAVPLPVVVPHPNPSPYQVATAQLLNTLTLMNTKNGDNTIAELDELARQFDSFMDSHPIVGGKWKALQHALRTDKPVQHAAVQVPPQPQISIAHKPPFIITNRVPAHLSRPPLPPRLPRPPQPPSEQMKQQHTTKHTNTNPVQDPALSSGIAMSAADSEAIRRATAAVRRDILQAQQNSFPAPFNNNNLDAYHLFHAVSHLEGVQSLNNGNVAALVQFQPPPHLANFDSTEKSPLSSLPIKTSTAADGRNTQAVGQKRTTTAAPDENISRRLHPRTTETGSQQQSAPTSLPLATQENPHIPSVEEQLLALLAYGIQGHAG